MQETVDGVKQQFGENGQTQPAGPGEGQRHAEDDFAGDGPAVMVQVEGEADDVCDAVMAQESLVECADQPAADQGHGQPAYAAGSEAMSAGQQTSQWRDEVGSGGGADFQFQRRNEGTA